MKELELFGVNEVFETIQGEATWTGTPAVFVRLQGCEVGCPWCDTKHTWALNPALETSANRMLAKTGDSPSYARLSSLEITNIVARFDAKHVVITGGEPCDYDLRDLVEDLRKARRTVQIETSGTSQVLAGAAWVTVSPKINMPGGRKVRADAVERANEIKMPVGKESDVEALKAFLALHPSVGGVVWLQPLSQSPKATKLCVEAATKNGWRLSLQTHKYLGVR